MEHIEL